MSDATNGDAGGRRSQSDQPGQRSGSGAHSITQHLHKDQQRNGNEPENPPDADAQDRPPPTRDSTG